MSRTKDHRLGEGRRGRGPTKTGAAGTLLRYGYVPSMLVGINAWLVMLASQDAPKLQMLGVLVLAIALSFLVERLIPYNEDWNRSHGDAPRDLTHAVVNESLNLAGLLILPLLAAAAPAGRLWPAAWPFPAQVLFAVVVLDVGITLAHYASHRLETLWRFHAVHHSVRRMYGFNGLMKHPIHQMIETAAGTTPLLVIGLPSNVAAALVFLTAVQLLVQHSNADLRTGPLRYVLATAEVHRFHHRKEPELGDVNFGLFFCVWDQLLGTFRTERRRAKLDSGDLGIGAEPDYPTAYLAQLTRPFTA